VSGGDACRKIWGLGLVDDEVEEGWMDGVLVVWLSE